MTPFDKVSLCLLALCLLAWAVLTVLPRTDGMPPYVDEPDVFSDADMWEPEAVR